MKTREALVTHCLGAPLDRILKTSKRKCAKYLTHSHKGGGARGVVATHKGT